MSILVRFFISSPNDICNLSYRFSSLFSYSRFSSASQVHFIRSPFICIKITLKLLIDICPILILNV